MKKDPTEFRQRFAAWKNGKLPYEAGLPKYEDGTVPMSYWDNVLSTAYDIPFISEKKVKLTNAGLSTGAVLSTNLLDSIADNAERARLPLQTAIGLAAKESTLGNPTDDSSVRHILNKARYATFKDLGTGQHINYGRGVNGQELINYHKGDNDFAVKFIHAKDSDFEHPVFVKNKSILQTGFEFYRENPDKYNPGQKNYLLLVNRRGEEVMKSPEVQKWLKERNIKKATGRFNRINPLLDESKFNLPKYEDGKNPALSIMTTPSIISMMGLMKRAGQYLRNRMYKTVHPSGYTMENAKNFIKGNPRKIYDNPNTEAAFGKYTNQDSIYTVGHNKYLKDLKIPHRVLTQSEIKKLIDDKYRVAPYNDEYDGISKVAVKDLLVPSKHVKDAYEFVYPNSPGQYPTITKNGNVGDNLWTHSHTLGWYEKGTDQDNKGVYDYYRDTWDINPFKGSSAVNDGSTLFKAGNTIGLDYFDDIIPFGNPFKIEGRIYR